MDGDLYYLPKSHVVDSRKLLESGKAIQIRTHTRFVHFPAHTHNFVELIYMCSGSTTHKVNGDLITLREGELLFLNQNATQEIYPAGENDIAVNFIILPAFFDYALTMLGDDDNYIRDFLLDCLKSEHEDVSYLHFQVADVLPIQNLMENLIWTLHHEQVNKRSIHQVTMGLLLMHLMNVTDKVHVGRNQKDQELMMVVYRYVGGEIPGWGTLGAGADAPLRSSLAQQNDQAADGKNLHGSGAGQAHAAGSLSASDLPPFRGRYRPGSGL